jgi:hypothetical protein
VTLKKTVCLTSIGGENILIQPIMEIITKLQNRNYQLDLTKNRIDFLDNRFYFHENGNYYPSATTILDCYPKGAAFYEWLKKNGEESDSIRDEAGRRGSLVHDMTERYDNGEEVCLFDENGNISVRMGEWAMFEKYVEFKTTHQPEVIFNELSLCSAPLGYAGTLDRVIVLNGKRLLIDIKTSNYVSPHFWLQLSCYKELLKACVEDGEVDGIGILHLNAKTRTTGTKGAIQGIGWQLQTCYDEKEIAHYFKLFKATHQLWLAENGSMMPKQFSYSLSHQIK